MAKVWQLERASSQMTLGKFIDRLQSIPHDTPVNIGNPHSYRGFYEDLAFESQPGRAGAVLELCRRAMGEVFTGYKGGDYQMGRNSPVWVATRGSTNGAKKIISINDDGTIELSGSDE